MKKTHRSIFLKELKQTFPELKNEINSQYGLLHCEMHTFHQYVQDQITDNHKENVIKAFKIIEKHFLSGNKDLVTAIAVSFLEHLDLGIEKGKPSWALKFLPETLRAPYEELRKYHGL
ncbi:MAG: hypothetical protein KDI61_01550 [Alphaproteobacteria bacterium]|nr:hypothetical protein [Alphaproteobacteria bacterium]